MKQSSVQSNNGSLHLILIISSVIVLFFLYHWWNKLWKQLVYPKFSLQGPSLYYQVLHMNNIYIIDFVLWLQKAKRSDQIYLINCSLWCPLWCWCGRLKARSPRVCPWCPSCSMLSRDCYTVPVTTCLWWCRCTWTPQHFRWDVVQSQYPYWHNAKMHV